MASLAPRSRVPHGASVAGPRKFGRALRRAQAREHQQLVRDLERLARLEEGGSPERPLVIDSPVLVDLLAVAKPCPLCGGMLRLEEHTALTEGATRLRVAHVACTACGIRRAFYYRLAEQSPH